MEDYVFGTVFSELKSLGVKVPKIKKFKSSMSKQNSQDKTSRSTDKKIFGVSLCDQEWILDDGIALPKFVVLATLYLRKYASKEIGLFRKAGSVARQKELRLKLENGESFEKSEPNDVASLLKQWLRELPEPLIPTCLHDLFIKCQNLDNNGNRIAAVLLTCHLLPIEHLRTLKHLLVFLADIAADSDKNKMSTHNLALIIAPNIFVVGSEVIDKSSNILVQLHTALVQTLIENAYRLEIPFNVQFDQGTQLCNQIESEISSDALDFSPKSKKKRRSGKVQDLFSGIRKLVGQNSTSTTSSKVTPDETQTSHTSASRSASKRKAEPHQLSMSAVKKQAISPNELKNGAVKSTPEGKIDLDSPVTNEKSSRAHTRKKSFGLLRRKERRRKKSQETKSGTMKTVEKSLFCRGSDTEPQKIEVPETAPDGFQMSPLLSHSDIEDIIAESLSGRQSVPSCFLSASNELKRISFQSTDSSPNCSEYQSQLSPYNLRFNRKSEEWANLTSSPLKHISLSEEKQNSRKQKSLYVDRDHVNISSLSAGHAEITKSPQKNVSSISADNFNLYVSPQKQRLVTRGNIKSSFKETKVSPDDKYTNAFKSANLSEKLQDIKVEKNTSQRKQTLIKKNVITSSATSGLNQTSSKCFNTIESTLEVPAPNSSPGHKPKQNVSNYAKNEISLDKLAPISFEMHSLTQNSSKLSITTESTSESHAPVSSSKHGLKRSGSKRSHSSVNASKNLVPFSSPRHGLKRNSSRLANRASSTSEAKNFLRVNITRQEAFIVKRSKSASGEKVVTEAKNLDNKQLAPSRALCKEEACSTVSNAHNNTSNKKSEKEVNTKMKRNSSRKCSIVRGRPNTVKTGLPTDLNFHLSNESVLSSGKKVNSVTKITSDCDISLDINNAMNLLKVNIAPELNISHKMEHFPFSPNISNTFLIDSGLITPNSKVSDSIFSDEHSNMNLKMTVNQNSSERKKCKKSRLKLSSNSDSKLPRYKNNSKVSRTNSFPDPEKKNFELSTISKVFTNVLPVDNIKENINISSNASLSGNYHTLTPNNIDLSRDKSDVWVCGKKFLDMLVPEEEIFNKRESIAMILRNNPGHVQAKVSLYDGQVKNPTHSTPNPMKFSTPLSACHRTYSFQDPHLVRRQSSNKSRKSNSQTRKLQISSSCDSTPRIKKSLKNHLPLPPKFEDCELNFSTPKANYPLKEVTNINNESENSVTHTPEKNSNITPVKNQVTGEELIQSLIKPKRNSFSGHTPYNISKVSRSESSPILFKKRNGPTKQHLSKSSSLANTLNDSKQSSHRDDLLALKTDSALSFEKLKSDELLDEWLYEM